MGEAKDKAAMAAQEKPNPLTRTELVQQYDDLLFQYRKATEIIRNLRAELEKRDFDYTSFFLGALFRVMEHPEMYTDKFVKWASESIESALISFSDAMRPEQGSVPTEEPMPEKPESE